MADRKRQHMILANGLKRTYKGKGKSAAIEAVRGINLEVFKGEIVGFLGPNGAGKTTTLKMLCTLLEPTDGTAEVAGCDLRRDPEGVRRRIGYVAQGGTTAGIARVGLEIVNQAELFGISPGEAKKRGEALLHALDLEGVWERKCESLSGGQRRRLDIVMGLIHEPQLVFLDEPSTGLDPQSRANLWNHIRRLRDEFQTTVFLTTHYMDEADSLSDRLLIIDHGEIVGTGTSAELKARIAGDSLTFTLRDNDEAERAGVAAAALKDVANVLTEGNVLHFQIPNGATALPGFLRELTSSSIEPIGAEIARPTLDDVFLTLTGRSLRD